MSARGAQADNTMLVTQWDCRVCRSENDDRSHCWECSQERGNWMCEDCGHVNKKGSDECETCGREKPDE